MSRGKNKPVFIPSLMVTATLCIAAFQYFSAEGYGVLWLSLTEPNQTPHSAFKGQGLPASGRKKNVNFQRQNCRLSFITPPPGVDIK